MTGKLHAPAAAVACVLLTILRLAVLAPGTAAARAPGVELDRFVGASFDATGTPGAAVSVTHGGKVTYERGFGSAGRGGRSPSTRGSP